MIRRSIYSNTSSIQLETQLVTTSLGNGCLQHTPRVHGKVEELLLASQGIYLTSQNIKKK